MTRSPDSDDAARLEALAKEARNFALHMMSTTGSLPPTAIADTAKGLIFCTPGALADTEAKERFAEITRIFAIAHAAEALVMVVEAWATLPDANGELDRHLAPSKNPNRKEIVALMLEDHQRRATMLLPILRNAAGDFQDLGDGGPIEFGTAEGRFTGLMPDRQPSPAEADKARAVLLALGMSIASGATDPGQN